jgi:ABC-type phosphate transport system auxiliary subunit
MNRAVGTTKIDKSLEVEIARSLHQSKGTAAAPRPASAEHEMADKLSTLFHQMNKLSMSEVDSLIDELHRLRTKLKIDNDLIERAIAQHSAHSQGVLQLTTIIADNVKTLPTPTSGQ